MVHGEEEAQKAEAAAKALFVSGGASADMPTTALSPEEIGEGIAILELLVKCGLAPSKGEGRRLVQQGGILAGDLFYTMMIDNLSAYIEAVISVKSSVICAALVVVSYIISLTLLKRKVFRVNMVECLKDNRA